VLIEWDRGPTTARHGTMGPRADNGPPKIDLLSRPFFWQSPREIVTLIIIASANASFK
jgi:hypothetical protein